MREQVRAWIIEKDEIEARLEALEKELEDSGFGMHGGLIDEEGYPLPDVEKIWDVRNARNQIAMLRNDHTDLMKKIENNLEHCFADDAESSTVENKDSDTKEIAEKMEKQTLAEGEDQDESSKTGQNDQKIAFCRVNMVQFGSPAEAAGLRAGDRVVSFGYADHDNHNQLRLIRDVVVANENESVSVSVLREDRFITLNLVPKKWTGQGLLGCHLVPL